MVFKKLTDRLVSAGTTAANTLIYGPEQAEKIRQLEAMGFDAERARRALNSTGGDVDRAAELLLLSADDGQQQHGGRGAAMPSHNHNAAAAAASPRTNRQEGTHVTAHNDEQMRRAIEESLRVNQQEETRQLRQAEAASMENHNGKAKGVIDLTGDSPAKACAAKKKANAAGGVQQKPTAKQKQPTTAKQQPMKNGVKSGAAINAGKAAAARNNNQFAPANKKTLDQTHPNVQLPEKMSQKSKEEQILRCANRLKTHVMAVDTLLRVLTSVRDSPENPKFRIIDRSNANYVKFVRDKPGAEDLLKAMNYRFISCNNELRLERHLVDTALLYLGISALERVRMSNEYIKGKKQRAFHAEMRRVAKQNGSEMQSAGMTEAETAVRLAFLSKCPKEPPEGRGAWMYVHLGDELERVEGGRVKRRFDGDDTLEDVLNWLGGCYGNEVLDKIRGSKREWCLCDLNRYPILPLDAEKHGKKTLQYLGLFPSGKLGVRLSDDAWRDRKEVNSGEGFDIHGSARGLGAASRSMLG